MPGLERLEGDKLANAAGRADKEDIETGAFHDRGLRHGQEKQAGREASGEMGRAR
jgi:hypothetical protein